MIETKAEAMKLFKKLFVSNARRRQHWKDMLESLRDDGEITARQAYKWYSFGATPTTRK